MMWGMSNLTITVYGITNCDTVKKARTWLASRSLDYQFHDFKKHGVPADKLTTWVAAVGWQKLVNRQGTTWRKLGTDAQTAVTDAETAHTLMRNLPSVVKRPVVEWTAMGTTRITVGFDALQWESSLDMPSE